MRRSVIHKKRIDDVVWKESSWDSQDFRIHSNDISYTTREIFTWSTRALCWVKARSFHLQGFHFLLFCNHCPAFINSEILTLFRSNNIRQVTVPRDTSNLFHLLNLVPLSRFKEPQPIEIHVRLPEKWQVWHVLRLMKALEHATSSHNDRTVSTTNILARNSRSFHGLCMPIDADEMPD
jgi:hypothetical protein